MCCSLLQVLASQEAARTEADLALVDQIFMKLEPLRSLSRTMRYALAKRATLSVFKDRQELVKQGKVADAMYIILSGEVRVVWVSVGG
jgi:CRP-like cAMP-binding protein